MGTWGTPIRLVIIWLKWNWFELVAIAGKAAPRLRQFLVIRNDAVAVRVKDAEAIQARHLLNI